MRSGTLGSKKVTMDELWESAQLCRVANVMRSYLVSPIWRNSQFAHGGAYAATGSVLVDLRTNDEIAGGSLSGVSR